MGKGAASVEVRGAHTTWWRAGGDPRRHLLWWPRGSPPTLLWTPCRVGENRDPAFHFVQFREYFQCNFSETKNSRKQVIGIVASC